MSEGPTPMLGPVSTLYLAVLVSAVVSNLILLPSVSSVSETAGVLELGFVLFGLVVLLFTHLAAMLLTLFLLGPISLILDLCEYAGRRKAARTL